MLFCRLAILKNVAGVTVSGGLGVEDVFARRCVCVRNRPREGHGRAMASSAKAVFFGGLKRRVALFRVAGVALCDIPKYGRRSTLDKSCCGFLVESHCQGCVKWSQCANSMAGVAFCEM